MGRQVYLTRLAFGRSAFECPDPDVVPFPIVEESSLQHGNDTLIRVTGPYVQQYDARGHPVNPRSQELGKRRRKAQNDVLAAIGAVERKWPLKNHGSLDAKGQSVESTEDGYAEILINGVTFASILASWWAAVLKTRLVVTHATSTRSFTQIVAIESKDNFRPVYRSFLTDFIGAGLIPTVVESLSWLWRGLFDSVVSSLGFVKHNVTSDSKLPRHFGALLVHILCAPMQYHSILVQTGLQSSIFPSLWAWRPGSALSPYPSFASWQQVLLSPVVVSSIVECVGGRLLRPISRVSEDGIASTLIHPSNTHSRRASNSRKHHGAHKHYPDTFPVLSRVLQYFGWRRPSVRRTVIFESGHPPSDSLLIPQMNALLPRSQGDVDIPHDDPDDAIHPELSHDEIPPLIPIPSARANIDATLPLEPSIRITSRDTNRGYIELEYDVPEPPSGCAGSTEGPSPVDNQVTDLSLGPAKLLAHFITLFLEREVLLLPSHILTPTFYVAYYLNTPLNGAARPEAFHAPEIWQGIVAGITPGSVARVAGNWALCTLAEYMFYAGLWGVHLGLTMWQGKRAFEWGDL